MNSSETRAQMTVWWVLWAAFQTSIFIVYHFLNAPVPRAGTQPIDSPVWLAAFIPFTISAIIRWLVLARTRNAQSALPLFVIGIAMAEATCYLGIFVFPAHKQELFVWSVIGIFQFVPYFVGRYFTRDDRSGAT